MLQTGMGLAQRNDLALVAVAVFLPATVPTGAECKKSENKPKPNHRHMPFSDFFLPRIPRRRQRFKQGVFSAMALADQIRIAEVRSNKYQRHEPPDFLGMVEKCVVAAQGEAEGKTLNERESRDRVRIRSELIAEFLLVANSWKVGAALCHFDLILRGEFLKSGPGLLLADHVREPRTVLSA